MKGLVYVSEATMKFDQTKLANLTLKASNKNKLLKITGYLYYEKNRFIQYIEGDDLSIDALFENIKKDQRHNVINVISQEINKRRFPAWQMNQLKKEDFVRTKMEHLITDLLLLKRNKTVDKENEWDRMAWEMIDRMAKLRTMVYKYPFA
ncbi:BLUF domain-containing protein [Sediminitomix flava]|uniref:FAD-dependent sensor of blue light n=1 Tax=Sediminitomix flava TaxID=379075 RepID=A0A315Z4S9_SEDFL|nr:BLUF domain-containing protein [Sediminitomix flava]PWJ38422.1 FAD-dependent sensor of blue light [Sediminitomix flava]